MERLERVSTTPDVNDSASHVEQRRVRRRLLAQFDVSRALATAVDLHEAAPEVLRAIGAGLEWHAGVLWLVDAPANLLRCAAVWHAPDMAPRAFMARTRAVSFPRGIGLPGRVWASGEPAWVPELATDANFPRLADALADGLSSAFAFPVVVRRGGEVLGAIEFYSHIARPPDAELLDTVTALGSQIGQFIERTRAVAALRESDARRGAILASALDAIVSIDHTGRIIDFNPAAERVFGYARADVLGRAMAELIVPPALRAAHHTGFARHLATGESVIIGQRIEIVARRADGSEFPVELAITRSGPVDAPVFAGHIRDITVRRRAEAEQAFLAEAARLLASSLDYNETLRRVARLAVPFLADWCIVYLVGEDGGIERVALESVEPHADDIAATLRRDFPIAPESADGVPAVIRSGVAQLYPEAPEGLLAADVTERERLQELIAPLNARSWICVPLTARGRTFGAISCISQLAHHRYDADDLALAHELAQRAALAIDNARLYDHAQRALRARDDFISIASHELRTPLTTIKIYGQMLERATRGPAVDPERVVHLTGELQGQIRRFEVLVSDLLDASRIQRDRIELRPELLDLSTLAATVLARFEHDPGRTARHRLTLDAPAPVTGRWDPDRLDQVITNLVSNALKYSPEGGEVRVRVTREGMEALLTVSDAGIGIAPEDQARLFEPFARAEASRDQFPGVGLGLYIVARVVAQHGGTTGVASALGRGATFSVRLPLDEPLVD